jgi:hypothetical protein
MRLVNSALQGEKPGTSMVSKLNPDQLNNSALMRSKTYRSAHEDIDPALAAKIIAAGDADLVRRRKARDAEEERHVAPFVGDAESGAA